MGRSGTSPLERLGPAQRAVAGAVMDDVGSDMGQILPIGERLPGDREPVRAEELGYGCHVATRLRARAWTADRRRGQLRQDLVLD